MVENSLFTERNCLLAVIDPASYTTEQNSGYVSRAGYGRIVCIIHTGVIGADLDVDVEAAKNSQGTNSVSFDAGAKDVTIPNADDNSVYVIEIAADDFSSYPYVNFEFTPGGASIFEVAVWGVDAYYQPVSNALIEEVL